MAKTDGLTVEEYAGWPAVKHALEGKDLWNQWEVLLKSDSVATFFQTPRWCVTWYRFYQDQFDPIVIVARNEGRLVGIAPLAKECSNGRIVFAGESMSDYKDFVCEDGLRHPVIPLFLSRMIELSRQRFVVIGQMQPESETKKVLLQWAVLQKSCNFIIRTHPCWRFRLSASEQLHEIYKKKSIRQAFKFYRRAGSLELRRIREIAEWKQLKTTFFQQQCLRQAVTGRPISFEDPRKQAFYSHLFESLSADIHFSALWFSERPIAFMFCLSHRGVISYGAPSIDLLESKRSPGILHIVEAMAQWQKEGFYELDLTLGSSEFKKRLANYRVEVATVYLYGRRSKFWIDSLKKWMTDEVKAIVCRFIKPPGSWESFKENLTTARSSFSRLLFVSPVRLIRLTFDRLRKLIYESYRGEIFRLIPDQFSRVSPFLTPSDKVEFGCNRLEDFLTLDRPERRHLTTRLQEAVKRIDQGHTLRTILVNGRLMHYGWSHCPRDPIYLPETRSSLQLPQGSMALYDFYTIEGCRGKGLFRANLYRIASEAFKTGVSNIYIVCEARNLASRHGIESVGFSFCGVHSITRVFGITCRQLEEELLVPDACQYQPSS